MKWLRRAHLGFGAATVAWSLAHGAVLFAHRHGVKPFTAIGWVREQAQVTLAVLGIGVVLVASWPRNASDRLVRPRLAALLAAATLRPFARYFTLSLGVIAVAALADGLAISLAASRRRRANLAVALMFAAGLIVGARFVGGAFSAPGRIDAPRPRRTVSALTGTAPVASAGACDAAKRRLPSWADAATGAATLDAAMDAVAGGYPPALAVAYCRHLAANLDEKARLRGLGERFSARQVALTAIEFERFRLDAYLATGVVPKRYFGFFDEQGDTALYETALRETIQDAAPILARHAPPGTRVAEMEVAVTFLAEGGALLLSDAEVDIERVHPTYGIGLDSFREGFARHRDLVAELDRRFGTGLGRLAAQRPLRRPMTFREAVLGTAVMYLYEKQLTRELLAERDGKEGLAALPLDHQFVTTSLVYNSGILFSEERIGQIVGLSMGNYLADANEANRDKRPWLPVFPAEEAARRLAAGEPFPVQLTSWNAVYHVLQRYGVWVALRRFSDVFDEEGNFRHRRTEIDGKASASGDGGQEPKWVPGVLLPRLALMPAH